MPVVVDASFALKWVLVEPYTLEADALLAGCEQNGISVIAPALLAYEAANVLYRKARPPGNRIAWIATAVEGLMERIEMRSPELPLTNHALMIAELLGQSAAYDAQYAALAEAEGCELWTADERCWRAAQPTFPWMHWVGERAAATR